MDLENCLKKIKDAELDIELLKRKNEKLCFENDSEIVKLEVVIDVIEKSLEEELKSSGEDKLECKLGSVSFKKMPDEWSYEDETLISWIISLPVRLKGMYLKIITTVKKGELKKQIMADNEILFENSKLIDDKTENIELFLVDGERSYKVDGISIAHQKSKFSINLKR